MESGGILSEESLSVTLRGISQRRREGILEISYPEQNVQLHFSQGKLTQITRDGEDAVEKVFLRLLSAGFLNAKAKYSEVAETGGGLTSLWNYLKKSGVAPELDEGTYRRTVRNLLIDSFLALDLTTAGILNFSSHPADPDLEFSSAIAVGQLLSHSSEQSRDKERLAAYMIEDPGFKVLTSENESISVDGKELWDLVNRSPGIPMEDLFAATLFNRLEYLAELVKLLDQGALEVVPAVRNKKAPTLSLGVREEGEGVDPIHSHESLIVAESAPVKDTTTNWSFTSANSVIANSLAVAQVLSIGFLLASLSLPWLLWGEMLSLFGR